MSAITRGLEEYLGDGLYVMFNGGGFVLRAPRENGNHWVFLEPSTLVAFQNFCDRVKRDLEHEHEMQEHERKREQNGDIIARSQVQ